MPADGAGGGSAGMGGNGGSAGMGGSAGAGGDGGANSGPTRVQPTLDRTNRV